VQEAKARETDVRVRSLSPFEEWERPRVVAEILSDGTVQVLDRAADGRPQGTWGSGHLTGSGWTIWWQRRRWG
jgi:hypothetical protein